MPLTEVQKTDLRRYLYYPVAGLIRNSPAGGSLADGAASWRFFQAYGFLEYKLNNMSPVEECRITGNFYAAVMFTGPSPTAGDQVTLTFTGAGLGAPVNVPVTATTGETLVSLCNKIAQAIATNATLINAGFLTLTPYGTGPFAQASIPVPEVAVMNPASFTLTVAFTGNTAPQLTAAGIQLPPTSTVDPSTIPATIRTGYLPILNWLEGALMGSTQNLDTAKADVWTARPTEIKERKMLYEMIRGQLADFLGIPLNPNKMNRQRGSSRMII